MKKLLGLGVIALSLAVAGSALAADGAEIFKKKGCSACHGAEGQGGLCPSFQKNAFIKDSKEADIAAVIKNGRSGKDKKYPNIKVDMPKNPNLTDDELKAVVAHLKSIAAK